MALPGSTGAAIRVHGSRSHRPFHRPVRPGDHAGGFRPVRHNAISVSRRRAAGGIKNGMSFLDLFRRYRTPPPSFPAGTLDARQFQSARLRLKGREEDVIIPDARRRVPRRDLDTPSDVLVRTKLNRYSLCAVRQPRRVHAAKLRPRDRGRFLCGHRRNEPKSHNDDGAEPHSCCLLHIGKLLQKDRRRDGNRRSGSIGITGVCHLDRGVLGWQAGMPSLLRWMATACLDKPSSLAISASGTVPSLATMSAVHRLDSRAGMPRAVRAFRTVDCGKSSCSPTSRSLALPSRATMRAVHFRRLLGACAGMPRAVRAFQTAGFGKSSWSATSRSVALPSRATMAAVHSLGFRLAIGYTSAVFSFSRPAAFPVSYRPAFGSESMVLAVNSWSPPCESF